MTLIQPDPTRDEKGRMRRPPTEVRYHWSRAPPFFVRAMTLADQTLFAAGPSQIADITATKPKGSAWLWAVSAIDGAKKAEYELHASPVFDSFCSG